MKPLLLSIFLAGMSASASRAAIIVSGDVTNSQAINCTLTITEDLQFTLTGNSIGGFELVLKDWVIPDGNETFASLQGDLVFQLNGVQNSQFAPSFSDNQANFATTAVTAGSGTIVCFNIGPVSAGETLLIKAGSWNFNGSLTFNPRTVQTFTGDMFIADTFGNPISGVAPEPSAALLAGSMGVTALIRRKRRA